MNERSLDTLKQRLDQLEQGNWCWKCLVFIFLLTIGSVVFMGQIPRKPAVLESEKFILRDSSGNMRAQLTMSAGGGPALFLYHKGERPENPPHAIDLQVFDQDPRVGSAMTRIGLRDGEGQMLAKLEVSSGGQVALTLRDEQFRDRAVVGSVALQQTRTGSTEMRPPSSLVLFDTEGRVMWKVP
jgi:hypothetical protein